MAVPEFDAATEADRCPFPKPFSMSFSGCPAFQPVSFTAADSNGRPLGTHTTCWHLASGNLPAEPGRFYPRCTLGTAAVRKHWAARLTQARLDAASSLSAELEAFSAPYGSRLFELKKALMASGTAAREADLRRPAEEFLQAIEAFMAPRAKRFDDAGISLAATRETIADWVWRWVRSSRLVPLELSDERLIGLRPEVQQSSSSKDSSPAGSPAHPVAPVYADDSLEITPLGEPSGLRLVGSIDASNAGAVHAALADLPANSDLVIDLTDILFCDVAGLRAIVETAQRRTAGHQLILRGIPEHVRRTMIAAGWTTVPNLDLIT
jgi:anti-anti-sigma factor